MTAAVEADLTQAAVFRLTAQWMRIVHAACPDAAAWAVRAGLLDGLADELDEGLSPDTARADRLVRAFWGGAASQPAEVA